MMQFSLSSASFPRLDFEALAGRARALGYAGVELQLADGRATPFLADPTRVADIFASADMHISGLGLPDGFTGDAARDAEATATLARAIEAAGAIGCRIVKTPDARVARGKSAVAIGQQLAAWLSAAADAAAQSGVTIVLENALSFARSSQIWPVLEWADHPSVAASWNVLRAAEAGEAPGISVPTLNGRIQHASVADARFEGARKQYCRLGQGDVPAENFIARLRGIGYRGCVTVGYESGAGIEIGSGEAIDDFVADAIGKLKAWDKPFEKPEKKHAKPGAKPGPKAGTASAS
jgi:fatty-acyl-CoA synthase